MKKRRIKILYWTLTVLFCLAMLLDGIGGVTLQEAGQEVMKHLGYPVYVMIIFGVAKILGAIAIIQTKYQTIKEWAFAGFTINFIGAFASRAFVGDRPFETVFPLIMLVIMFITYSFWKKFQRAY
jgi:uncharacterized membrane protein YphA (DoxX/SURF4 family)